MTTSATTLLPRFLLPALSPMWRVAATSTGRPAVTGASAALRRNAVWTIRYASSKPTKAGQKGPLILEKPAKFNPPSHGARLPKNNGPKHYGGPLSGQEVRAQRTREYPGMMAPEGTWAHWFFNSRKVHLFISLGTLTTLAISTLVLNFSQTSPFKHLLPPASEFWSSPIQFIRTWVHVMQLHERDRNEKAIAAHSRHTDDVAKRQYYRKVHGLDKENPIANFLGMKEESEEDKAAAAAAMEASPVAGDAEATAPAENEQKKKWLGIF
ncbi:hypothetical protein HER10_EVM0012147 [Colletotrichum scovillei]|uniref:Major facilitator superfamily transporter n=1 Tax=Colletotrichum scovillei TaxID=1209932 RepID=A0A9P7UAZ6_9PEZI|nr:uncharacterized protein HER10_EVM0012147 [Colletotrichum scovillei]KAF4777178.1 hypothetical protein HER10_EVM0012147 [Colletotrichum scovillei]KAG7047948.1 hypothetical protein JMJ77_0011286 [Colletotrichum scovillei]KAG7060265.1 hypothetical protein JMJ78_0015540 [Colletotrichum scovillei]KAG7067715.1 hypothetical protein JMJ76_0009143 [Colletotrichum scovillei]